MTREHLEHIARIVASSDEVSGTDGECLDLIWMYLAETCGVDPDNFRNSETDVK